MAKEKKVTMPSGATLVIRVAPFAVAKNLYQAILRELRAINIDSKLEMPMLYKELFCIGFSSPYIEQCLWECFKFCTYGPNGLKIDQDTFEPIDARDDYMTVCMEVATENVSPFAKSLYAEYKKVLALLEKRPA